MNTKPLFSVLVAHYNNHRYFEDLKNSLDNQTYDNWECIIVDDGSSENALEQIKKLTKEDKRYKIIENVNNQGTGFTKRKCVEFANGDICGFIDPDDAVSNDAINIMVKNHMLNPEASMIYSNYIICDENLNPIKVKKTIQIDNKDTHFLNTSYFIQHFCTFKRSHYLKTDGINPNLKRAVDQDLYLKLFDIGGGRYLDADLYLYRIHDTGISTGSGGRAKYWHWMAIMDAAKRRGTDYENEFINFIQQKFVEPKTKPFQESLAYGVYKLENKIKSIF